METWLLDGGASVRLIVYALVSVFLAGIVRGYTGFGFSALTLLSLTLVVSPALVVPILLILEVIASVHMLPSIWRRVDRRIFALLLAGCLITVPVGAHLLANLSADAMRLVSSLMVLLSTFLLWRGYRLPETGRDGLIFGTGLISGVMTGAAGVGGTIAVVMFLSISIPVAVVRATMVAFLMGKDMFTLAVVGGFDLVTMDTVVAAAGLTLPLFAGVMVGRRLFAVTSPVAFERFVLLMLMVLALAGIVRALVA